MTQKCCFCSRNVLGISGFDAILDTVYLEEQDSRILDDHAYGHAHGTCLKASKWNTAWHQRITNNIFVLRQILDVSGGQRFLGWNDVTSEYVVVDGGLLFWISRSNLSQSNGAMIANFIEPVSWKLESAVISKEMAQVLSKGKKVDGLALIKRFDLGDLYEGLDELKLIPFADDPESTIESLEQSVFDGEVEYSVRLDTNVSNRINMHAMFGR